MAEAGLEDFSLATLISNFAEESPLSSLARTDTLQSPVQTPVLDRLGDVGGLDLF
jgi:hypothetical protein